MTMESGDPLDELAEMNLKGHNSRQRLTIGSDVEIASHVREDLERHYGQIVYAEGKCWRYNKTHWEAIADHTLRIATHLYDGAGYISAAGTPSRVKLNKSHVDSTINEMQALITEADFFAQSVIGINCASGFIRFAANGIAALEPHNPNHRCRHTLPGHWYPEAPANPPRESLLHRLLFGVFKDDKDVNQKIELLAEVFGSSALGYGTKLREPRAVILKGETAENGKSQILDAMRAGLPASACCSVPPGSIGDDRHIIGLPGKLLNATDELSSAKDISSDTFKAIITGETVQGRDVYKSRMEFRPVAQHVFATNTLPAFEGGMDRGVQRRLLVIPFNRVIPIKERIENIGRRIGEEEADLLLAWTIAGASRLIRQRSFTIPQSSKDALNEWLFGADPVLAWSSEKVTVGSVYEDKIRTSDAYAAFRSWAIGEGFDARRLPAINAFVPRISANIKGIEYRRNGKGRFFLGMILHP